MERWVQKAEKVKSIDELSDDGPEREQFSTKVAASLMKLMYGELRRRITLMEEQLIADGRLLNGRQILYLVYQQYRRNAVEVGMAEFRDLQNLRIQGDTLQAFIAEWDRCQYGMQTPPSPQVKETLIEDQICQCRHFEQTSGVFVTKCWEQITPHCVSTS